MDVLQFQLQVSSSRCLSSAPPLRWRCFLGFSGAYLGCSSDPPRSLQGGSPAQNICARCPRSKARRSASRPGAGGCLFCLGFRVELGFRVRVQGLDCSLRCFRGYCVCSVIRQKATLHNHRRCARPVRALPWKPAMWLRSRAPGLGWAAFGALIYDCMDAGASKRTAVCGFSG